MLRALVAGASAVAALVACELLLAARNRTVFHVWTPYSHATFTLPPGRAPGVHGPTHFSINGSGLRGDDFGPDAEYRILAIGGSTTECLILDDEDAWPQVLQGLLRASGRRAWVGNAGKAGLRTAHHELEVQHLLPQ